MKAYQNGLQLILQCKPIIDILCDRNNSQKQKVENINAVSTKIGKESFEEGKVDEQKLIEDEESLVILLEQRLQFILRSLTKLFVTKNSNNSKKEYVFFFNFNTFFMLFLNIFYLCIYISDQKLLPIYINNVIVKHYGQLR